MTMRNFSDAFLDHYLETAGQGVIQSVGAYEFEGVGAQLFEKVDGDFFSILGLPLIPLLVGLREAGAIPQ
jgi:septum formation protein